VADGRIQHIEVQVEIAEGIRQRRPRQEAGEPFRDLPNWDRSNGRPLQKRRLWRIEVPGAKQKGGLGRDGLKSGHGGPQVMPTQAHRHGEAHAIQEARRGSLRRIVVAVGIEPEGGAASGCQATQGAHCRVAIAAEYQRKVTGAPSGPNGSGQSPGQFERGPDFGGWVRWVILDNVDGGNNVSLTFEVTREPGTEEMLGAGPAAPGALARIVWD
jgi:hypothetical protein